MLHLPFLPLLLLASALLLLHLPWPPVLARLPVLVVRLHQASVLALVLPLVSLLLQGLLAAHLDRHLLPPPPLPVPLQPDRLALLAPLLRLLRQPQPVLPFQVLVVLARSLALALLTPLLPD